MSTEDLGYRMEPESAEMDLDPDFYDWEKDLLFDGVTDSSDDQYDLDSVISEWGRQLYKVDTANAETISELPAEHHSEENDLNEMHEGLCTFTASDLFQWIRGFVLWENVQERYAEFWEDPYRSRQREEVRTLLAMFYANGSFTGEELFETIRWSSLKQSIIARGIELNRRLRAGSDSQGKEIKKRSRRSLQAALVAMVLIVSLCGISYSLFVFSNIPFFVKWRTLYIETAMSTLNHQWMATSFIPDYIIDDVMKDARKANEDQKQVRTSWADPEDNTLLDGLTEKEWFYKTYWELNEDLFEEYLELHPEYREMGYRDLVINNLDCNDDSLHTRFGEVIRAINVPDNVIIIRVKDDDYVGTLATVKDPSQVNMKKAKEFGMEGDLIETFCGDQVLAINGSGFIDEGGLSNGSTVVGSFVLNGVDYGTPDYNYLFFGMRPDNRLHIQWGVSEVEEYRWAFQFSPALIVNGKTVVEGSYGWGLQPRSAIGQTRSGDFLMLIVDGRQVGYSIGCLVEDCASILQRHRAYQAVNLDGGSSSIMAYQGKIITKNSSKSELGRELPNSIVVSHPK